MELQKRKRVKNVIQPSWTSVMEEGSLPDSEVRSVLLLEGLPSMVR